MEERKVYLRYIGTGAAIVGVPARDLTLEEFEKATTNGHDLLASGIYELAEPNTEYPGGELLKNIAPTERDEKETFIPARKRGK